MNLIHTPDLVAASRLTASFSVGDAAAETTARAIMMELIVKRILNILYDNWEVYIGRFIDNVCMMVFGVELSVV